MDIANDLAVHVGQVPTGTSGPVSPNYKSESAGTDSNQTTSKSDHTPSGSDTQVSGGTSPALLEEDPFASDASKILFDGMDGLRRCDAAVDLDLPQLVIVGQQSAGKSSLLRSLTDIPFPVGDGLCTRFATRIISRRTAPGTADVVRVSIERGESDRFNGQNNDQKEPFNPSVSSITADVFKDIFKQASTYMGITDEHGKKKNNFSSDVLRIELRGPTRSHFGILDVPGIFHAVTETVTKEEMERVTAMVISHMKQPQNFIICVAPATNDLANQEIFTLAKNYAESSRVVGVFTKCDKLTDPKDIIDIVRIVRDNSDIALHNGWFVVQNLPKNAPPTFDREQAEKATFSSDPWIEIPAKQRGTAELKKFLANTLSSRIRKAFPDLQRKIKELLAEENNTLKSLGKERESRERRREYLHNIVGRYQELARDSLTLPERLPSDAMKLRGLTQKAMQHFADDMKSKGHLYNFVNVSNAEINVEPEMGDLYKEIRNQISVNRGEELTGMTNPAVLKPLFIKQTSKWESLGQKYLEEVVKMSKEVALLILDYVSLEFGIPENTKAELKSSIEEFEVRSRANAIVKLREFCHKNSTFLLATTDEGFKQKVTQAQKARFIAAVSRYRFENPPEKFFPKNDQELKLHSKAEKLLTDWVIVDSGSLERLFEQIHPRATRNTEDEIHDLLKAYYEITREYFKTHVSSQIVEVFMLDPKGPLLGLSEKYVLGLKDEQVDILGGEDESVVAARSDAVNKIKRLDQAMKIARETWTKSMQVEK